MKCYNDRLNVVKASGVCSYRPFKIEGENEETRKGVPGVFCILFVSHK